MKFLVVVSALLVVAAAQRYNGPYHVPVIGPNGVPQEPPEVVAARQKHLSAFQGLPQPQAQYNPPQQQWNGQQQQQQWQQPQQQQQWQQPQQQQQQWQQPQAQYAPPQPRYTGPLARIGADGMPQYDGAVAAARAAHQAAYAEVNSRNAALHSAVPAANHWQG